MEASCFHNTYDDDGFDDDEMIYGDDPVLRLLHSPKITYKDIEALCASFDPTQQEDIKLAFRILTVLEQYMHELEGWSFKTLRQFDFDEMKSIRQFDVDLAVIVGSRCDFLFREINSWGVDMLKTKVSQESSSEDIYSDANTVLTMLVLKIIQKFANLRVKLQWSVSRSTFIKITAELDELTMDGPGITEVVSKNYKNFVVQLIKQMESTPVHEHEAQDEMFQVVTDIYHMFLSYADAVRRGATGPMDHHHDHGKTHDAATAEDEAMFDDHGLPAQEPPSMENSWASEHFGNGPRNPKQGDKSRRASHRRTASGSSSTPSTVSTTNTHTSITDELPSIMHAFRHPQQEKDVQQKPVTPHYTPSSLRSQHYHEDSPATALSIARNIKSSTPKSFQTKPPPQQQQQHLSPLRMLQPGSSPHASSEGTLQVKMVSNRMMVKVDSQYVDLQDWVDKQNSNKPIYDRLQLQRDQFKPRTGKPQASPNPAVMPPQLNTPSSHKKWIHDAEDAFGKNYTSSMDAFG